MEQHELRPPKGAKHNSKRVGRGTGSGTGTSAGRGRKGQRKRGSVRPGFESGHITTMRRLPRLRGFKNPTRVEFQAVNVADLERVFDAGATIDAESLAAARLIDGVHQPYKVLGRGELTKSLSVRAPRLSATAKQSITAAGGSFEELARAVRTPRNRIHRRQPAPAAAAATATEPGA